MQFTICSLNISNQLNYEGWNKKYISSFEYKTSMGGLLQVPRHKWDDIIKTDLSQKLLEGYETEWRSSGYSPVVANVISFTLGTCQAPSSKSYITLLSGVKNEYLWLFSSRKKRTSDSTITNTSCIFPRPCISIATPSNLKQAITKPFAVYTQVPTQSLTNSKAIFLYEKIKINSVTQYTLYWWRKIQKRID